MMDIHWWTLRCCGWRCSCFCHQDASTDRLCVPDCEKKGDRNVDRLIDRPATDWLVLAAIVGKTEPWPKSTNGYIAPATKLWCLCLILLLLLSASLLLNVIGMTRPKRRPFRRLKIAKSLMLRRPLMLKDLQRLFAASSISIALSPCVCTQTCGMLVQVAAAVRWRWRATHWANVDTTTYRNTFR